METDRDRGGTGRLSGTNDLGTRPQTADLKGLVESERLTRTGGLLAQAKVRTTGNSSRFRVTQAGTRRPRFTDVSAAGRSRTFE